MTSSFLSRSRGICGRYLIARKVPTTPTGTLIRKIIRQPLPNRSASMRKPARIGPSTAASPMIGPNGMNAFCRSSGWKDCFTMASPCGIITAPNAPCSTRKAISAPAVGASAESSDATVNPAMPMMNIRRRPTRSPAGPR